MIGIFVAITIVGAIRPAVAEGVRKSDSESESSETITEASTFNVHVGPFLKSWCCECHGEKIQNGERRFDRLVGSIRNDDDLIDLQDIVDQLNLGDMPPADARQPSDSERQRVIEWITATIDRYHATHERSTHETVLRRLNSREYRNTIRDLFRLDMTMFDPTASFPRDRTVDHVDTIGDSLVTSGYLLQRYLDAAERIVDKAMLPLEQPPVQTWTFRDSFRQQPEIDQVHRKTNQYEWMTLYEVVGADKHEGAYGPIHAFADGVPFDGIYEIRFRAEALHRNHPYDPEFYGTNPDEPLRLGIVPGDRRVGQLHKPQPVEPLLTDIELADELKWYSVRIPLDAGYTPRFTFRNGPIDMRSLYGRLLKKYPDQFPKLKDRGIVETRFTAIKYGKLPQIRIHEIEIKGPIHESWPTASQQSLLGSDWNRLAHDADVPLDEFRPHVRSFATRAYRRPVRDDELDRLLRLMDQRHQSGQTPIAAFGDAIKAALCSPAFLYLDESRATNQPSSVGNESDDGTSDARAEETVPQSVGDGSLSSYALASRLSYFLWSSMPDDELIQLADRGTLSDPQTLTAQVDRMLDDPRSDAFIDGFNGAWLTLSDLGSSPPDRRAFPEFYHDGLDSAMRHETHLFVRHIIDNNLSVANFLDSDFTFVNGPLARLYGITPPSGNGFRQVALTDRRRGGLLGQASVLTVTANGIDTSPVVRGVWLLENLLGTPPSPPPPDVEPLDPDIRGATSIRGQLEKHRTVATCNACHRKIDPLGFALENFNPIGGWRESYGKRTPIDAAGELPGGESFSDIAEFKSLLMRQRRQFTRSLVSRLLSYATGRRMTPIDRPLIESILDDAESDDSGFRDLIRMIASNLD